MKIEDYKYSEWEEEKNCQMEKMKLTKSLMVISQDQLQMEGEKKGMDTSTTDKIRGDANFQEPTNAQNIMEGVMVTNAACMVKNKGDKTEEENMGVNGGVNSNLKDVENSKECSSGFRSMEVSPLQVMDAQTHNVTSVTMADKSESVLSKPIDEPLAL
ncbi:hypothetical protein FRX31_020089 [Thalictrum thalictroides]|uniref:Uncharacterized protein n=1 Tax=Thalictrum thalictroides TaxID=46969 RepID=A0A7J6VZL2_THATH|nr:hypothetical protein FRX31_020089 [Thalictrum thalictroides]